MKKVVRYIMPNKLWTRMKKVTALIQTRPQLLMWKTFQCRTYVIFPLFYSSLQNIQWHDKIIFLQVTETDATANQTPNTGNSTNMKSRARKITEALEYNQTETATATIPPLKNIKIEKASLIDLQLSSAFLDGIIFYICQLIMQVSK